MTELSQELKNQLTSIFRANRGDKSRALELVADANFNGATEAAQLFLSGLFDTHAGTHDLTDMGNAERFEDMFGETVRYSYERNLWLIYTGRIWEWDDGAEVMKLAKRAVLSMYEEAARTDDDDARKHLLKWAKQSSSRERRNALLDTARPELAIKIGRLDQQPMKLNVLNGTIDLATGELKPHDRDDLITQMIRVEYDPAAQSEVWDAFLDQICEGKSDVVNYLERALGYSITGSQGQQVFFLAIGPGSNGKSTLLNTIMHVLGDYAAMVHPSAFMVDKSKNGGGPNEELARLYLKRFVPSTELEEGQKLAVSLVKSMTGGETISHERKYEHAFSFRPTHKLWLCGNHEPVINDTTNSTWRRLKRVNFNATIPEEKRILDYDRILADQHGQAILAWLVLGCLEWQSNGLNEPESVLRAIAEYRAKEDLLHDFLAERCVNDPQTKIPTKELYKAYTEWAQEQGDKYSLGNRTFATRLEEKGYIKRRGHGNVPFWHGIRLLEQGEDVAITDEQPEQKELLAITEPSEAVTLDTLDTTFTLNSSSRDAQLKVYSKSVVPVNPEAKSETTVTLSNPSMMGDWPGGRDQGPKTSLDNNDLPDCPGCGQNVWIYSPDGRTLICQGCGQHQEVRQEGDRCFTRRLPN